MSKHINFIYAADENYNKQLLISINSLLEQFSGIANIHIIHKAPASFIHRFQEINKFDNLDQLNIYEFNDSKVLFPNIEGTHISEATYYRLFVDKYIPNDIEEYVYLDADIICLSDPHDYLRNNINQKTTINKFLKSTKGSVLHLKVDPDHYLAEYSNI